VILLTAVAAGFTITYLRARLTRRKLRPIQFKAPWLVFLAVLPQVILFQIPAVGQYIPDAMASLILVSSQAVLVGFALVNLTQPGMWVLGAGLAANFAAIVANGGWMPISPETVRHILPALPQDFPLVDRRLGLSKDWIFSSSEMKLPWLSDRLTLPGWITYQVAFSIGDVLIAIGAILMLWSLSSPDQRSQNELS
jgi:hypothetical protein